MAKQLNVNLNISANTEQAKAQLQSLQTMLNNLTQSTVGTLPITKEIAEAQEAASKLKVALNQSMNVDTGKFDLSKFNSTLKASGTNLEQIKNRLVALGPTGQQAFLSLAQSIASAEIPTRRVNKALAEMGTTLKNTIKWQFSSSMLHGLMSATQSAYRYAQDLNESLNNIRIVTGSSADEMDKFAIKANKAAKSLSASTLEYTNASLIYYQQGLSDNEVAGRTEVTLKMANVTRQSATEVSDQLTAIWNNFDNGTKSLEYYADVITALGAATASSSDEISEGLNKFAAVAETVGLSYEYAAAALATVTATTRQSADVVGTAFKTLFARIQDLELGETLDDGTTLGTYSLALAKVGISIKDTSGQMKDMDVILEEMAAKWETLGKAEQTALAQSVAGVRQYTQLIALMDNWDFMKENLSIATNAEGALQLQADIYAESWEAARDRVKASIEAIYSDLLKDDFFIGITNGIEKVLTLFDQFLDSIGGAKGLLTGVASILLTMFSEKAAIGLENIVYNFKSFVGLTKDEAVNTQLKAYNFAQDITAQTAAAGGITPSSSQEAVTAGMRSQLELSHALAQNREKMSELQYQEAQAVIEQNQAYSQQVALLATKADSAERERQLQREAIYDDMSFGEGPAVAEEALDKLDAQIDFGDKIAAEVEQAEQAFQDTGSIDAYRKKMQELADESAKLFGEDSNLTKKLRDRGSLEKKGLENKRADEAKTKKQFSKEMDVETRRATVKSATKHMDEKAVNNYIKVTKKAKKASEDFAKGQEGLAENTKASKQAIESFSNSAKRVSQTVVSVAQSAMSLSMAFSSLSSLDDIWSDETLTGGQKLTQTFMSLGTALPMLVNGIKGLNSALGISTTIQTGLTMAAEAYAMSQYKAGNAISASALAQKTKIGIDAATIIVQKAATAAALEQMGAEDAKDAAKIKSILVSKIGIAADKAEIISKKLATGASIEEAFAEAGLTTAKSAGTVATWLATAANWAFNASLGAILLVALAVAAAIAVIVGIAVLLVNAFKTMQANSPEGKLKALEEESKLLAEQLAEVKDRAEELQAAFDDYNSVTEKLASCTKGTEEWYAALNDVNNKVLEIMQQYPELASYIDSQGNVGVTRNAETGALEINENFFKDNQKQLENAILANTSASQQNAIEQKQIEASVNKDKAMQALWGTGYTRMSQDYYDYETGEYGNKDFDRIAAAFSGKGEETIEDVIKGISIESLKESYGYAGYSDEDFKNAVLNTYGEKIDLDSYANEQLKYFNEMVADYPDLTSALTAYSQSVEAATLAQKTYNDSLAQSALANNETVKNSKYSEEIMEASGDVYAQLYEQKLDEIKDTWGKEDIAQINGANDEAQKVWKEYLKAAGLNEKDYKLTDTTGNDNNREFVFKKAGSTEEEKIDLDTMQKIYASSLALEALGQAADVLAAKFAELGNSADAGDKALLSFLSQDNFEDATQSEYNDIAADVENAGGAEAYLAGKIGGEDGVLDDADAQAYGYESAAALIEAFNQGLQDIETAWDTISLPTEFDNADVLTLNAASLMTDTFNKMSDEGDKALSGLLDKALKGLDDKDKTLAMDEIAKIDWSDWDAMDQLQEILETYKIDLKTLDGVDLDDLTDSLRRAGHAVPTDEVEELKNNLTELISLSEDIEIGKVITKEQYDLLVGYNKELAKYFSLTADGYKVVGGIDQLTNLDLEQQTEQMRKYQEAYEKMNWASWGHKDDNGNWVDADWNAYANGLKSDGSMLGTLNNIMNNSNMMNNLGMFGYDQNYLQSIVDGMNSDDPELQSRAREALIDFYAKMNEFNMEAAAGAFDDSTINMMNAASAKSLSDLNSMGLQDDPEAYANGLKSLAAEYESCEEALAEYIEAVDKYGAESDEAKAAQDKLTKSIKKAEWRKFTKQAKDAAKALKGLTNPDEVEENLIVIQNAFEAAFGMKVSLSQLEKFRKEFEKWGNATEEESDDIATHIMSMINADNYDLEAFREQFSDPLKFNIETDDTQLWQLSMTADEIKSYIANNPPVVSATGEADFSALITEMLTAGATAADVAAALSMLGQTEMTFYGNGSVIPNHVDFSDPASVAAFINALSNWQGSLGGTGEVDAEAIAEVFPGGKIATGTGGGRHTGGSGGGGGGKKNVTRKDNRNDVERYHYLNNQLEDLEAEYDSISEAADRAFGADKLKLLDDQIAKTKELQKQNEDYIDSIKDNLSTDRAVMQAQYQNLLGGSALQFDIDENGEIRNFDDIQQSMINDYNAKAGLYESGKMSEEDWQAYEKLYEQVEKDIEMYEQSEDDLRDALLRRKTLEYQEIDEKLSKIEYAAEVKLEVSQDDLDLIEHQLDLLDDKAFSSAERISKSVEKASNLVGQIDTTQKAMKDILSVSGIAQSDIETLLDPKTTQAQMETILKGKNITEAQIDSIRDYRNDLLSMNQDLIEIRNDVQEEVITAFEEWNEELDEGIEKFNHYNSVLESYQNIIGLVGKDVLGVSDELIADMNAIMVENSINQLESVRAKYNSIIVARDEAKAKSIDMSLTEEDRKFWEEQYKSLNQSAQETQEELLSTWETTLEGIVAQFESSVETAINAFNKAIYDGGLEGLSEDFQWNQEMDDMYLDDYKQIYELSKLTRDINKSMDDTKSIAGKQKLKGLIEDINKLQEEGVEMSEYDLEYLQAEYDLRLAEIALEDAQRAKDTVRLSRDSEGNFSYVYTQNTDAVDEAQQKYEDALYSMQDLSSNYIDEMSAQLIETSQAMQEELAALRVEDYASIEEYYAAVADVEAKYQEKLSLQEAELKKAIGNNKELYEEDWANYATATGYKISAAEDFVTAWGDTSLAKIMNLDDATSFTDVISGAATSLVEALHEAAKTYYSNVDKAGEAAGTSTGQFAEVLQENIDTIKSESEVASQAVEDMAGKMDKAMQDVMDKTAAWQQEHSSNIDKIIADNVRAAQSYNALISYLTDNAVGDYEISLSTKNVPTQVSGGGEGQGVEMATGGYTGSWGSSGKLAWLHEKELVLNKDDTANMLQALEMTQQLMDVMDAQARQLSQGMGMMMASTIAQEQHDILEQYVEIKADFPNVSNHTEIEDALSNLINTASQFANRRRS